MSLLVLVLVGIMLPMNSEQEIKGYLAYFLVF
jgi:hypothetical protein